MSGSKKVKSVGKGSRTRESVAENEGRVRLLTKAVALSRTEQGSFGDLTLLSRGFFERDAATCARELVGTVFRWGRCAGIVVETEAYSEHGDEACHTFFRPSAREFVEKHPAGTAYVYFNYGMYWLTNVLVKNPETGERGFVLLRALEPAAGLVAMRKRRGRDRERDLCSGPGKLSMALGIHGDHHGASLVKRVTRGFLHRPHAPEPIEVKADRRVGISRSQALAWRFLAAGNSHVSVPFGKVK